jgi:hypothetical protein
MVYAPRYYYHVTQEEWPNKIKLRPRSFGDNRSDDEPTDSRICVAPTIEGCLVALGLCLSDCSNTYVYRTVRKVLAKKPYNVVDASISGEAWLTKPTTFKLYGEIVHENLPLNFFKLSVGDPDAISLQVQRHFRKALKQRRNWLTIV